MLSSMLVRREKMYDDLWAESAAWEASAPLPDGWPRDEQEELEQLLRMARELHDQDPAKALALELQAAERGSAQAMEMIGWRYWAGVGVDVDKGKAADFYCRALRGGNREATIGYARLSFELGRTRDWEGPLQHAADEGFVPAFFWLAWLRYQQNRSTRTRRRVFPLIESAANAGHPMAIFIRARWLMRGELGVHRIPHGVISLVRWAFRSNAGSPA